MLLTTSGNHCQRLQSSSLIISMEPFNLFSVTTSSLDDPNTPTTTQKAKTNVIKVDIKCTPPQLPDLLDHLRDLVAAQHREADRALIGAGDFELRPPWSVQHPYTSQHWKTLSAAQQLKASKKCFQLQTNISTSTSTDEAITVPNTPGGGKKPHQRKRIRNAKTKTITTKKCRFVSDSE